MKLREKHTPSFAGLFAAPGSSQKLGKICLHVGIICGVEDANVISFDFSLAVIVLSFAAIFKVLPDARVHSRHVWVGANFTGALFVAGKTGIGWYLGREATVSSYGTAGSLGLVLLWIYYSSIILLFGAEFTQVWTNSKGEGIQPKADAEHVDGADRVNSGAASSQ